MFEQNKSWDENKNKKKFRHEENKLLKLPDVKKKKKNFSSNYFFNNLKTLKKKLKKMNFFF